MRITKEFIKRNIAGDTILVPIGDTAQNFNGMITLTDSAEFIWDNLEKTDNMDEMVQRILAEFNVDEATARRDVAGFIGELLRHGIAECTKRDKSW